MKRVVVGLLVALMGLASVPASRAATDTLLAPPDDTIVARWLATVKLPPATSWTMWKLRSAGRKQILTPVQEFPTHEACMAALEPRVYADQDLYTMVFQIIDPKAGDPNQFLGCFPTLGYYTKPYRER